LTLRKQESSAKQTNSRYPDSDSNGEEQSSKLQTLCIAQQQQLTSLEQELDHCKTTIRSLEKQLSAFQINESPQKLSSSTSGIKHIQELSRLVSDCQQQVHEEKRAHEKSKKKFSNQVTEFEARLKATREDFEAQVSRAVRSADEANHRYEELLKKYSGSRSDNDTSTVVNATSRSAVVVHELETTVSNLRSEISDRSNR
jgi:chromosome segregation ATPase